MSDTLFLHSPLFERHGASAVFSLRGSGNLGHRMDDGDAFVDANLERLVKAAGLPGMPHQVQQQVHGIDVLACSGVGGRHLWQADILVTEEAACPVGVRVADCLPVLLADPEAGVVAAVHAGWRGTVRNVVAAAITAMQRRGAIPERIIAALGPSIGFCCFTIGENVAGELAGCCDGASAHVRGGRADLAAINSRQLRLLGLAEEHIEHLGGCTCCESGHFFSYRRDGEASGRHLAVAVLGSHP